MMLTGDIVIASEKLTKYLLVFKKRNDKSQWLAKAGYKIDNWQALENDLRGQILQNEAVHIEYTPYGELFEIRNTLVGPSMVTISVCTIWLKESETGIIKFITMYPDK